MNNKCFGFRIRYFIFILFIMIICGCVYSCDPGSWPEPPTRETSQAKPKPTPPVKPETYWEPAAPEEQGIDSSILLQMLEKIRSDELNVRSLIVVRNQRLVLESYIYPYTRYIPHNTKSASKSIISALTGIALREKWIDNLDQPVQSFFPRYFPAPGDPQKKSITLRHLLTMSSGLNIREQSQDTETIFSSPDPVKTTFDFSMPGKPGQLFNYLTPLTLVMASILTETSGKSLEDLANLYLFEPLGIGRVTWKEIPKGYYFTDAVMCPLDMAKFGVLFLEKGKWEGKQVVPAEWIEESTKNQVIIHDENGDSYGYFWWRNSSKSMYMALGWGGQQILVMPKENMVIVTTASHFGAALKMVYHFIIPAVKSTGPLPPNPQAVEALRQIIQRLQNPTAADAQPIPPFPELVNEINGQTYLLEPNAAGLVSMAFDFPGKSCRLTLGTEKGTSHLEVGLDNIYRISDSGRYGERPDHNKMALKGKWKSSDTFFLDFHSIGRAEQALTDIRFSKDGIDLSVEVVGTGITFPVKGLIKK